MKLTYSEHSALIWAPTSACIAILALRLFVRIRLQNLGIEDLLMTAACSCLLLAASFTQVLLVDQAFVKQYDHQAFNIARCIESFFLTLCLFFGKASVSFLVLRISGDLARWRNWLVYSTLCLLAVLTVPVLVLVIVPACDYPKSTWAVDVCVQNDMVTTVFAESYNFYSALFDILYSVLPITILWKLKLSMRKKVAVLASLCLGWTAAVFSVLRALTGYVWQAGTDEELIITNISSMLEPSFLIISGSIASLTPLFEFFWDGRPLSPRGRSSNSAPLLGKGSKAAAGSNASSALNGGTELPPLRVQRITSVRVFSQYVEV